MRNYPKIIKELKLGPNFNKIADEMNRNGFVLKYRINQEEDYVSYDQSNGDIGIVLPNVEHNAHIYLPQRQKKQLEDLNIALEPVIKEKHKITNLKIAGSVACFLSSTFLLKRLLANLVAFGSGFCGGLAFFDKVNVNQLNELLEMDTWFLDNANTVSQELSSNEKLYKRLHRESKDLLMADGSISLNNIEDFPKNDLKRIRNVISKNEKKKIKKRNKNLKKMRGM